MRWWRLPILALSMLSGPLLGAAAVDATASGPVVETRHLKITTSAVAAKPNRLSLFVDVTPKPKMHLYPPGQQGFSTITLTLDPNPAFTAAPVRFPPAEKIVLEAVHETQFIYAKPFRIVQDLTLTEGRAGASPLVVKGSLRYQACDDRICYLPQTVPLTWSIPH